MLMSLPRTEWEREKNRLTYEAWAEKTKAAEQSAAADIKN
jgi:hypothetical protein